MNVLENYDRALTEHEVTRICAIYAVVIESERHPGLSDGEAFAHAARLYFSAVRHLARSPVTMYDQGSESGHRDIAVNDSGQFWLIRRAAASVP